MALGRTSLEEGLGLQIGMKCRHSTVHRTARVGRDGGQQSHGPCRNFWLLGLLVVPDLEQEHQLVSNRWRVIAVACVTAPGLRARLHV